MITAARSLFDTVANPLTPEPPTGVVEPSQPRSVLPANASGMGRDDFLKMLVAQLKNQDPLNPMDGKDMAAQLAQFSSVEQLIQLNESVDQQKGAQESVVAALGELQKTQNERADELATLIEGQMAMATVGKIAVTPGNNVYVDNDGKGTVLLDAGTSHGPGRITFTNSNGSDVRSVAIPNIGTGQQAIDISKLDWKPPLEAGKYTVRCEVATDGGPFQTVKTYTTGRITGMRYEQGNPILIISDDLSLPMSQLTQIRG